MYNTIKYLLLLMSAVVLIVDSEITVGCYRQPCSQHTLTCPARKVIAVAVTGINKIGYGRRHSNIVCPQDQMELCNATCCAGQRIADNTYVSGLTPVNESDLLSIYRTCSNQPTCTVTSPYSPDTDYDYILYPYSCIRADEMYNMMKIGDISAFYSTYLYYSGKTQITGTRITRCCNITGTDILIIESVYIDLTEESSHNVKIFSGRQVFLRGVDGGGGILFGHHELVTSGDMIYHMVLDNLQVIEDDYVWIRIYTDRTRNVIRITCGDCSSHATATSDRSNNNGGGVNTGLTVGIIVVCLLLIITWFILGVYCIRRKMGQKQISEEDHNGPDTVNSSGRPEHDYTGLMNLNGPDTVNKSGPEHDYTDLVNRNGSDTVNKSEPEHSAVPNETEHEDITTSNPTQVQTESSTYDNSKNTLANVKEQRDKDNAYLRIID